MKRRPLVTSLYHAMGKKATQPFAETAEVSDELVLLKRWRKFHKLLPFLAKETDDVSD